MSLAHGDGGQVVSAGQCGIGPAGFLFKKVRSADVKSRFITQI